MNKEQAYCRWIRLNFLWLCLVIVVTAWVHIDIALSGAKPEHSMVQLFIFPFWIPGIIPAFLNVFIIPRSLKRFPNLSKKMRVYSYVVLLAPLIALGALMVADSLVYDIYGPLIGAPRRP